MKYEKKTIAQLNKKNVLEILRCRSPINKSRIAKLTELSIPTVMKITDEFMDSGLIRIAGKGKSCGGKPPEMLEIIPNAYYMLGVDIGRSKTISVIMNLEGEILNRKSMKTGETNPEGQLIDRVTELIFETISEIEIPVKKILGIGIVTPGLINNESGKIIFSRDFHWVTIDLKKKIQKELQMPVKIESSNRAMAIGEGWFGAAKDISNYICFNLGHGIGSAIIENGKPYCGNSGSSGEIGHMTLERDGPMCECGNRGCLEALASGNAIAESAKREVKAGRLLSILSMENIDGDIEKIEARDVFNAAKAGDETAIKIVDKATEYIGIGIANYINLLDPEMIVFAGGMINAGKFFLDKLEYSIRKRRMKFAGRKVKFEVSRLGVDAAAIGACTLILSEFIEQGGRKKKGE